MTVRTIIAAEPGNVHIYVLSDEELTSWIYHSPLPSGAATTELACDVTKYGDTSSCRNILVRNDSAETVGIEIQVSGSGFEEPPYGEIGRYDFGGPPPRSDAHPCSEMLAPGANCYQWIAFSPCDSGVSIGRVEVRVTGSGNPITRTYELTATADYPPELEAADQVRKAHLDELMRISHVARVSLDDSAGDIAINVEVAHEEDIPKVEREVPPRLGGYRVEVTLKLEEGWAL